MDAYILRRVRDAAGAKGKKRRQPARGTPRKPVGRLLAEVPNARVSIPAHRRLASWAGVTQGVPADSHRQQIRLYTTRKRLDAFAADRTGKAARAWANEPFLPKPVVPVRDIKRATNHPSTATKNHPPTKPPLKTAELKPSFEMQAKMAGFDGMALQAYPELEEPCVNFHPRGQTPSGIVDGAGAVLIGNRPWRRTGQSVRGRASVSFAVKAPEKTQAMTFGDIDLSSKRSSPVVTADAVYG
ncbi:hypothetical protein FQR65_LT20727 [Abscondita terminalis]|nr:hypothetical protein FQR65_LT20727 [Abscondita terminalis]